MARRRGQVDERKTEAILDAAATLFADKGLQTKMDELRRAQTQKGFFDTAFETTTGSGSNPLAVLDELRKTTLKALRELQPAGHEASSRPPSRASAGPTSRCSRA